MSHSIFDERKTALKPIVCSIFPIKFISTWGNQIITFEIFKGTVFTIDAIFFSYKRVTIKGNFHMARFRLASQLPNQNRTFVTAGAPFVCNAWMDTRMICNIWSTKTSSFNAPSTGVVIQTEMYWRNLEKWGVPWIKG